jgi:hypothetical protein
MAPRSVPVTRIAAALAIVVGILIIARGAGGPRWRTLRPGAEFTTFRGDVWCKGGPGEVVAIRLDPARVRLRVRHYSLMPERRPLNIVEWQRRTGALAVFNAGQFYEDFSYMGLLVCDGRVVSGTLHPGFKAALVAAPESGASAARVLDLTSEPLDPAHPGWREVAQSFMLFDHSGALRTRKSDRIANRTVVAEDRRGRLLVITSEGAYTLSGFAELLKSMPLELSHAMCMDGGYEAELCVSTDKFRYASFGRWDRDADAAESPGAMTALPAVVTVMAP